MEEINLVTQTAYLALLLLKLKYFDVLFLSILYLYMRVQSFKIYYVLHVIIRTYAGILKERQNPIY